MKNIRNSRELSGFTVSEKGPTGKTSKGTKHTKNINPAKTHLHCDLHCENKKIMISKTILRVCTIFFFKKDQDVTCPPPCN